MGLPSQANEPLEFAHDETSFRRGLEPQANDVFIALMGVTGSGKSTFISLLTDSGEDIKVGHGLQACTQTMTPYVYKYSEEVNVYLIDTPGFDDTNRDDADVLKQISFWLRNSWNSNVKLNGILYLHRITDIRMPGSGKRNLITFKKLCGPQALEHVILVTTRWEEVNVADGVAREKELTETEDFWGWMVDRRAKVERHYNNAASAKRLVDMIVEKKAVELTIQNEMATHGIQLNQTEAGKTLDSELAKERERHERKLAEMKADFEEALRLRDAESAEMSRQEIQKYEAEMKKIASDREKLRMTVEEMEKEHALKTRTLLKEQQEKLRKVAHEEMKVLRQTQKYSPPRTRSHPGPNRIQECRSVTLVGESYYFCGPRENAMDLPIAVKDRLEASRVETLGNLRSLVLPMVGTLASPYPRGFKEMLGLSLGHGVRAFALGTSGSFYAHSHKEGQCVDISFLPDYPGLAEALEKRSSQAGIFGQSSFGCPRYMSLGVNGHYYISSGSHQRMNLPKDLTSKPWWPLQSKLSKVKAVWLGMNDAWVVQLKSGERYCDLKGQYAGKLEEMIRSGINPQTRAGQRIKAVALNLTNPDCFVAIWGDGSILCDAGAEFDQFCFEEYATKNFGTTF